MDIVEPKTNICNDCHRELPEDNFSVNKNYFRSVYGTKIYRKKICRKCEEQVRISRKEKDPWHDKVRATVYYHAKKVGMTTNHWMAAFDLSYEWFTNLFQSAWDGDWCKHCGKSFQAFGREEMELDQINRSLPQTRSNWQVIHGFDNTGKGEKPPDQYDIECKVWRDQEKIKQTVLDLPISQPIQITQLPDGRLHF